jgi:hypothetical protein
MSGFLGYHLIGLRKIWQKIDDQVVMPGVFLSNPAGATPMPDNPNLTTNFGGIHAP